MKKLEELGISPAPWKVKRNLNGIFVVDSANMGLSADDSYIQEDARLIAESPNLYRDLCEAVYEYCSRCEDTNIEHCRGKCFVSKWRDTIARAAGEEVAQ